MDYSEEVDGSEFSACGTEAIISGGARLCAALSVSELPPWADLQREIQSGVDPMPELRTRLLSGVGLFRGRNDSDVRTNNWGVDSCVSGYAVCAGVSVAFGNDEIRAVDRVYVAIGGSVRPAGVCAVALGGLLAGALACGESEIVCRSRLCAGA